MSDIEIPSEVASAQVADALVRLGLDLRVAPPGLAPVDRDMSVAGQVLPARHYGSVDIFLEAFESANGGEVLVVDNGGRTDEGCIGDLTVIEAMSAKLAGMVVWGLHRDTPELVELGLPVFSYGSLPLGPVRVEIAEREALQSARFGSVTATSDDFVFADADGALFVHSSHLERVVDMATQIRRIEETQADAVRSGHTLRDQLEFESYLKKKEKEPGVSFRQHLREIGGAIEE